MMDFSFPLPSLKDLCFIRASICLWSTENVTELIIENVVSKQEFIKENGELYYSIKEKREIELERTWNMLKNRVKDNVLCLPLPLPLRTDLLKYTIPIALEIEQWFQRMVPLLVKKKKVLDALKQKTEAVRQYLLSSISSTQNATSKITKYYFQRLTWNTLGFIDNCKTAFMIVNDNQISDSIRIRVAHEFCLENQVADLVAMQECETSSQSDFKTTLFQSREGEIYWYGNCDSSVKFFWDSLKKREKKRASTFFPAKLISTGTNRFLLHRMTLTEQISYLEKGAYLKLLEWPYQNIFLQITRENIENISHVLLYRALEYLWEGVSCQGYNSIHADVLNSYLSLLPLDVVLLFAAVKLADIIFFKELQAEIVLKFKRVLENGFKIKYNLKTSNCLMDIHRDFEDYNTKEKNNAVQVIKALIERYVSMSSSDGPSQEKHFRQCCDIFEERRGKSQFYCCKFSLTRYLSVAKDKRVKCAEV